MLMEPKTYRAILDHAGSLRAPSGLDPILLLMALAAVESSGGFNNQPRVEPAYRPGGRYCNQALYEKYGDDAAASWGPLQIMFVTARELGYQGTPQDLAEPSVSVPLAIALINRRIVGRGAQTLEQIADGYNSGNFRDDKIPAPYIAKVRAAYADLVANGAEVDDLTS
ncbi:MAG: transglycosylase SLT domain-containing protein [Pseudomonadota bacterium]